MSNHYDILSEDNNNYNSMEDSYFEDNSYSSSSKLSSNVIDENDKSSMMSLIPEKSPEKL